MPSFTTKDLLVELRERFATGGMMPIPQLTMQDTELMWQCLWDVAEAQALSELQHLVAKTPQNEMRTATAAKNNSSNSGGGNNNQTFGLKLGIGSGAGGGSAFSVLVGGGSSGGGTIYDDGSTASHHHHPAATVLLKVHQDFLSHYNLKCSKMQTLLSSSSSSPTHTATSFSPPPREQDVNAAKMFFEVANGCKDPLPPSSCIDENEDGGGNSRPSTSSSLMGNYKKGKGGGTSSSLKSSRNFSHELCRRFIRTVAEVIGEKGARWDVSIEFPPFGVLRIKERVIDFTVCLSPKLQLAASSSTDSDNNNNVRQGQQQALSSKPPLTPFSSQEKRMATTGNDDDDTTQQGGGGGGGSPLRRVLREQARERMLLQKHGDSYIRARVDAKNAPKGGFNSCGIGIDHNVIDTSETDSLFVIRPATSSTVVAARGSNGSSVQLQANNNNNVTDMKRLLISHRALRPPSTTTSNGSAPSPTNPNKNTSSLPRVGGRGGADAVSVGGVALVRALDSQLHSLRERLTGPLAVMEGELYAAASPARSDASPSRTIHDDTEGGGRDKGGGKRRDSTSSRGGGGLTIGLGGRIRSPPISLQAMTAMPSTTTTMPTAAMTAMPTLPTTRQLNHRTVQGGGGGYARKSTRMLDAMGTTQLQDQAMKNKAYREELDQQTSHSSTAKKTKKQLEKDADSKRIELDVLSAANDILSEMSQKKEMKIEMSHEAAEIAKRKDIKHEAEMLKRAGEGNTTKKRGGGGRSHHPQSKHIV